MLLSRFLGVVHVPRRGGCLFCLPPAAHIEGALRHVVLRFMLQRGVLGHGNYFLEVLVGEF